MKSQKYSDKSVKTVLGALDGPAFVRQLGISNGDCVTDEHETRCFCPVCQDRSKKSFIIDKNTGTAFCTNLSCQASSMNSGGGDLLDLYALVTGLEPERALEQVADALAIPLEKRSGSTAASLETENFRFVEVGYFVNSSGAEGLALEPALISFAGQESQGRGVFVELSKLEEFATRYRSDVYRSHFMYNNRDRSAIASQAEQSRLPMIGDFYIVFNASSSAEIVHAINQAIDLVERLKNNYDIPYDAISVYYTNRNIEVHADYTAFGITPISNLHEIFRRMACAIIGVDPLKPERTAAFSQIDLDVYRYDYLYNIPGTLVSTGSRDIYKIRMSYAAFKKMSYQRLHEFSLRRPDLPDRERRIGISAKAHEFYSSVQTSLVRDTAIDESDKIASLFYRASEQATGIGNLKELSPTLLRRLFDESRQVLTTPSASLNQSLAGGLYPGYLYVVASFPGSGMTKFVLQIMNSVAANQNGQCLFVGFQQGIEELFKHSLSAVGGIPSSEIDEKRQHPADLYEDKAFNRRIFSAYEQYQKYASNITILEGAPASNLAQLSRLVQDKKEEARSAIGHSSNILIVIDSLQLMAAMMRAQQADLAEESGNTGQMPNRWDVDALTSRLKALARELDVTILATFDYYISHRGLFSELTENDPATRELLFNTQFADVVMVLVRQGNSLLNLRDYFKTHLIGTPREHEIEPLIAKLTSLEEEHSRSDEFQALTSEFIVLDIVKNRSGPCDKILYIHKKPISIFEPLSYKA